MKCSICNAENPSDAKSCHQCGFSLSLTQPAWPDFPTVEIPEPVAAPVWPDLPEVGVPPSPSEPVWPEVDASTGVESDGFGFVVDVVDGEEETVAVLTEPPDQAFDDDQLARSHIARGFEAIRKGLDDQAKWEFEQARDLADNPEIVQMAQAQLSELLHPSVEIVREQAPSRPAQPRVVRPIPARKPTPPPTPIPTQIKDIDWDALVRIGLVLGLVNSLLTGLGAVLCLGLVFSPAVGFLSGWLAAGRVGTARKHGQASNVTPAIIVGGITGLGGWLGGIIGHPIWVASASTSTADPVAVGFVVACAPGILYILLAVIASVFGWRIVRKSS